MSSLINPDAAVFMSDLAGLGENQKISWSYSRPATSMAAFAGAFYTTSRTFANTGSIPDIQVQLSGLNSTWYWLDGIHYYENTSSWYSVTVTSYFSGNTLYIRLYVSNNDFATQTIPAFTVNITASLYDPPF